MIIKSDNIKRIDENSPMNGKGVLHLKKINSSIPEVKNLNMFSIATLEPGSEVGYHIHYGEMECYYILSGEALYNDNGKEIMLSTGDATYTPDGEGHGIKNMSDSENLVFIALVVR